MFAFDAAAEDMRDDEPAAPAEERPQREAVDPVDVVEDMLEAMGRLSDLLEIENAALMQHRHDVTAYYQDEKTVLTRLYVQRLKALAEDTQRLEAARAERGAEMVEAGQRLKSLSDLNATLLKSAMAATRKFLDAVVSSAREYEEQPRYARNGKATTPRRAAAMTFNQTL